MPSGPAPAAAGVSVNPPGKMSILTRTHRLLRGRYPLAVTLAVCGGHRPAASPGYAAIAPRYAAQGLITIDPRIIKPGVYNNDNLDHLDLILANEMGHLSGNDLADKTMADKAYVDAYRAAYPGTPLPDDKTFLDGVTTERPHTHVADHVHLQRQERPRRRGRRHGHAAELPGELRHAGETARREGKMPYDRQRLAEADARIASLTADLQAQTSKVGGDEQLGERIAHGDQQEFADEQALRTETQVYQDEQAAAKLGGASSNAEKVYAEIAATGDPPHAAALRRPLHCRGPQWTNSRPAAICPAIRPTSSAMMASEQANRRVEEYAPPVRGRQPQRDPHPLGRQRQEHPGRDQGPHRPPDRNRAEEKDDSDPAGRRPPEHPADQQQHGRRPGRPRGHPEDDRRPAGHREAQPGHHDRHARRGRRAERPAARRSPPPCSSSAGSCRSAS